MKAAVRMLCRLPALVLLGVLAVPAAWAGDAPVAPFPGTSVSGALEDGGAKRAGAPPPVLGAAAAGAASGPTLPGAAGDETGAAPGADAEAPGTAAPSVDALPDGVMDAKEPATPADGSRLLRALADLPKTLGRARSGVPDDVGRPGIPRVFAAGGCPRALLRRLLAGAAGEADALSALGIEREILTLCRERQEVLAGLFEAEARLSELRQAGRSPLSEAPAPASSAVRSPGAVAPGVAPPVESAAPSPLRAALGGAAEKATEADTLAGDPGTGDTRAAEPRGNAPVQAPRYAWFSIIGTAGALRAGVTDGTGVWFVREGDPLPGGATIAAIAGRPPGVRVTGAGESGGAALLPFRARPGGGP